MMDDLTRNVLEQRDNIENQRNRELNSNREEYIKQLQQEIQELKDKYEKTKFAIIENCDLRIEIESLKDRINKASDLLKLLHYQFPDYDDMHNRIEDIEKILKEDNKEEQ